jgi:hypothetical protein
MNWRRIFGLLLATLVVLSIGSIRLAAQTQSSGDIAGVVSDPSNAVVPDAKVNLKDNSKGNTQDTKTNKDGGYRFYLLAPGSYTVTVTASGFQTVNRVVDVNIGQISNINFQLPLGSASQTVTVTEAAPLLQTENGNVATTMNERQVQEVPNPGNDLSYVAQTAPGVVMNTQSGYGNFSANGLPGNSNLFTINGMDDNDPYLNLNNSGATNLLLGQNEVQEATVVSNGYSGQFGTLAGANITYITKSGSNEFHGRAIWYWNGSALNAESFISHEAGNPKPFSNANQWGGDMGGPIMKDKLFWYANSEGLRVVLPSAQQVNVPTLPFEQSVVNNLNTAGLNFSIPFYCQGLAVCTPTNGGGAIRGNAVSRSNGIGIFAPGNPIQNLGPGVGIFNILNSAPGAQNAKNILGNGLFVQDAVDANGNPTTGNYTGPGCNNYPGLGVSNSFPLVDANGNPVALPDPASVNAPTQPCAQQFLSNAGNFSYEWLLSGRIDYNYGSKDRIFLRVQSDRGDQATFTDAVNPLFNAHSFQPEYQGQLVETHTLGATAVNQFILSTAWYSAIFQNGNQAASLAEFPTTLLFNDGSFGAVGLSTVGGENFAFPQGRDVTQFQLSDDFSKTMGNHALKIGAKFRRYDVTDHGFSSRQFGLLIPVTLDDFAWGGNGQDGLVNNAAFSEVQDRFYSASEQPFAYYTLAGYVEDGLRVRPNLTITGSLRAEHQSNPICRHLCFNEATPFTQLDHNPNIPYNQAITTGLQHMLPGFTNIQWEPRVSFAWQPFGTTRGLVVRGGIGIFYDGFQGSLSNNFASNLPGVIRVTPLGGNLAPTEQTGNLFQQAGIVQQAIRTGFLTGQTVAQIRANSQGFFVAPAITSSDAFTNDPMYQKWSLGVQKQIGRSMSIDVQYVGNHGIHELIQNAGINAHVPVSALRPNGFGDLPTVAPDTRFRIVNDVQSNGVSNYNGLIVSFKRVFSGGIVNVNYAWSHANDESEGLDPFNLHTNSSILFQEDPFNLRRNYGPADWDVRHYVSANFVWDLPIRRALMGHGWKPIVDGWEVSGTVFFRTGLPFTVIDGGTTAGFAGGDSYGGTLFANFTGSSVGQAYTSCGVKGIPSVCLDSTLFASPKTDFSPMGRNAFYGPKFFDSDVTVMKKTKFPGWEHGELGIGLQMFNIFNHPNFDQPVNDINQGGGVFGHIFAEAASPTSILGSFLGGDNSPRLIQVKLQLTY